MSSWISPSRRSAWSAGHRPAASLRAADPLLLVVDACLAGVIFFAPLVLGGRHDLGRMVFIVLATSGAVAWFVRQALRNERSAPHWAARVIFALAGSLLVLQLVPLPASLLAQWSPRIGQLLPLWAGSRDAGELGVWQTLSLAPQATRLALAMLAAYGLLFFTVLGRVQDDQDAARLMRWIGLSAGLMAAIGLLQFVVSNGKFLWVYEHPSRDASERLSGAFANRNHFAHFLSLGIPALAAWLALRGRPLAAGCDRKMRSGALRQCLGLNDGQALAAAALLVFVAATALVSCSRGGTLALAVAGGMATIALYRVHLISARRAITLLATGVALLLAVSLVGADAMIQRLGSLTSQSLDEIDESAARRKIWQANIAAIRAGGWFGAGAGSHTQVYPVYLSDPPAKRYTHAESGYLQVVTENGLAGSLLLACGLSAAAGGCFRALRRAESPTAKACAAASAAALAASAAHSLCDFVWYIPACLSLTLIYVACAVRLGELGGARTSNAHAAGACDLQSPSRRHPWRLLATAAAAVLAAAFAVGEFVGPAAASLSWDAYQRMSNAHRDFTHKLLTLSPEKMAAELAASRAAQQAALEAMIAELDAVLSRDGRCEIAHRELAKRALQLFDLEQELSDNPMPAAQIRDAAIASQFRSSAELRAWLARAVGSPGKWLDVALDHARQAASLSPLDGECYASLAAVCFLRGERFPEVDAYLSQAVLVRPYDGDLLFDVGQQWVGRGLAALGYGCWAQAYRVEGPHRLLIARCIAGQLPVADLLKDFAPGWDALPEFWRAVRAAPPAEVQAFLAYAEGQARRETDRLQPIQAAAVWRTLAQMEAEAGRVDRATALILRSSEAYPEDFQTRRMCGFALAEAGRFDEAAPHLRWCLERRPDDVGVQNLLTRAGRERLAARPR
jgi:tetratricopeptide (TPR) repeat protein